MRGNGIRHETTSTGTGAITLTGVSGWPGYDAVFGTSGTIFVEYTILNSDGVPIESGIGSLVLSTMVLTRSNPEFTWNGTTYSKIPAGPLSLAAGTKQVICAPAAERFLPASWAYTDPSVSGWLPGVVPMMPYFDGFANRVVINNRAEFWLYPFVNSRPFDRVSVRFAAAVGGSPTGVSFAVAIYALLADGTPGRRLALFDSWTTVPVLSTATQTSDPLGSLLWLPSGLYWVAFLARWTGGTGTPTLAGSPPPVVPINWVTLDNNSRNCPCVYKENETTLTDPATTSLFQGEFTQAPVYVFGD